MRIELDAQTDETQHRKLNKYEHKLILYASLMYEAGRIVGNMCARTQAANKRVCVQHATCKMVEGFYSYIMRHWQNCLLTISVAI